jgi:hypothetical protein
MEFLRFWWQCCLDGWEFGDRVFTIIEGICILVGTALLWDLKKGLLKSWCVRWEEKLERQIMKTAFLLLLASFITTTIFVAPFLQYREEHAKVITNTTHDFFEKNRPRLEPTLIIDGIAPKGIDRVDFHFEVVNKGFIKAENIRQSVFEEGNGHRHIMDDPSYSKILDPDAKMSFIPKAWHWEPADFAWRMELTINYECVISGKKTPIKSSYKFQINRWSLKIGEYFPNSFETTLEPAPPRDLEKEFTSLSDVAGSFVFQAIGRMPTGSATNVARQLYINDDLDMIRFYFRTTYGRQVMLTNYYATGTNLTNFVDLLWDTNGAMLQVNGEIVADPANYFEEGISNGQKEFKEDP